MALVALSATPLAGGEKTGSTLSWHARGVTASEPASRGAKLVLQSPPAGNNLQWANRGMARAGLRPQPRPAILKVSGYEDAAPSPARPAAAIDADAHKDPFYVADQRAAATTDADQPVHELPIPGTSEPGKDAADDLALPDWAKSDTRPSDAAPSADATGDVTTSDDAAGDDATGAAEGGTPVDAASQFPSPDADDLGPEPRELKQTEDDLFPDTVPSHPDEEQLPLMPDDLSQGIDTGPGGVGCKGYEKQCREALRDLQARDITKVVVGVVIEGTEGEHYPCDCRLGRDFDTPEYVARNFSPTLFTWKASGLCHKPLYFEDVQLERYGHSWNPVLQPFISGAHFFVSVPLLPYNMGLKPPHECVYTLGYYRPGNCAPYMLEPIPLSVRAALFEAAGATAFAFWFWPPN